ncbi:hypothetical protein Mapa_015502 [Marchantia paleacea]|nr:hypothetical protein Mapa_015502 [Marchantia paleacea]
MDFNVALPRGTENCISREHHKHHETIMLVSTNIASAREPCGACTRIVLLTLFPCALLRRLRAALLFSSRKGQRRELYEPNRARGKEGYGGAAAEAAACTTRSRHRPSIQPCAAAVPQHLDWSSSRGPTKWQPAQVDAFRKRWDICTYIT